MSFLPICTVGLGPPPSIVPVVTDSFAAGVGRIAVIGTNFITNSYGVINRVVVVFDDSSFQNFYSTTGPDAGINPPGTTEFTLPVLPDTDTGLTILNSAELSGKTVDQIGVQDWNGYYFIYYNVPNYLVP